MRFRAWPVLALSLLSGSQAVLSGETSPERLFHFRDPVFEDGESLQSLLAELSVDPDVRISVAMTRLKALRPGPVKKTENGWSAGQTASGLAAIVASEGFDAGIDPRYMVRLARRESRFDPFAESPTSTASGLFQFTNNTWLCSVREFGTGFGIVGGDHIYLTRRGACEVSDPKERLRLLALRSDPVVSSRIAAAFSLRNYRVLTTLFGRPPTNTELYALHFLGEDAGIRFLETYRENPNALATSVVKALARANPEIFFDGTANARSVKEVFMSLKL